METVMPITNVTRDEVKKAVVEAFHWIIEHDQECERGTLEEYIDFHVNNMVRGIETYDHALFSFLKGSIIEEVASDLTAHLDPQRIQVVD